MKYKIKLVRSLCLLVTLAMLLSCGIIGESAAATENTSDVVTSENQTTSGSVQEIPSGYSKVASNSNCTLFADMKTGDFIFKDNKSSKLWCSTPLDVNKDTQTKGSKRTAIRSLITVEYVDMKTAAITAVPSEVNSYAGSVQGGNYKVLNIDNGIRVEFTFKDEKFFVPVEIVLKDDCLSFTVKSSEITMSGDNWITSVSVLPALCATGRSDQGYMFVPSGSGALINLNNGKDKYSEYSQTVYGEDAAIEKDEATNNTESIIMPVYGVKSGSDALTAVITKGAESAEIHSNITAKAMSYNLVYSKCIYGIIDSTQLFETDYFNMRTIYRVEQRDKFDDYEVCYYSLSGDNANYIGMANTYRNYLISNNLLQKDVSAPSLNINLYGGATKEASFLGIPYEKYFAMTTFTQAKEILADLKQLGTENITLRYTGWNNSGLENKKVNSSFNPLSVLGGKSGFKSLNNYCSDNSISTYFNVDFSSIRKSGRGISALSETSQNLFKSRTPQYNYMLSVKVPTLTENEWYLVRPQLLNSVSNKFQKSFAKYSNKAGVSLSYIGNSLYSDFSKQGSTRIQSAQYYKNLMSGYANGNLGVDYGNSYTYQFADRIFELPQTSGNYLIFDATVPFCQIVLHGFINYTSQDLNRQDDLQNAMLKCIEQGSDPYFCGMYLDSSELIETNFNELYSSNYSMWSEQAASVFKNYNSVYSKLYDQKIADYTKLNEYVTKTTYENGKSVYVNYSDTDQTVDSITIEAKSFSVKG